MKEEDIPSLRDETSKQRFPHPSFCST